MKTQVVIIGAGPAGLLLGQLLHQANIDNIIIEAYDKNTICNRIRAGVIEEGTRAFLDLVDCAKRIDQEGCIQEHIHLIFGKDKLQIDLKRLTNKGIIIYGQSQIVRDLIDAREQSQRPMVYEASDVILNDMNTTSPSVTYTMKSGEQQTIRCDFIAGCDGAHSLCRHSIPQEKIHVDVQNYPVSWLGLLANTPPVSQELTYGTDDQGHFYLCSMRSQRISRYYISCPATERITDWSDEKIWKTLKKRMPPTMAAQLVIGPSLEKNIFPLRSVIIHPMRYGRLFLVGDAAHVMPPAGAKGLNLAMADAYDLSQGLRSFYQDQSYHALEQYAQQALMRAEIMRRFSWQMVRLLHVSPHQAMDKLQQRRAEFEILMTSESARRQFAKQYVSV